MSNIVLALIFCVYLIHFRPFQDAQMNQIQIFNEYAYLVISMHQLCFTDFASGPEVKILAGWSFVGVAILNLLFPNLFLVVASMYPDIREALRCQKVELSDNCVDEHHH